MTHPNELAQTGRSNKKYRLLAESVFFIKTAYRLLFDRSGEVSIDIHDAGYCDR